MLLHPSRLHIYLKIFHVFNIICPVPPVVLVPVEERLLSGQVGAVGTDPEQLLAQAPYQFVESFVN